MTTHGGPDGASTPEPPKAPDSLRVMSTGEQPFLTRAARREAESSQTADAPLPVVAHLPRYLTLIVTVVAAILVAVSAMAGETILAAALLLGSLVIAWGWPGAIGLTAPKGPSVVLALSSFALVGAIALAAQSDPYLRWASAALALGLVLTFLQQLLRRDGRAQLTDSAMGTLLGLVVIASGVVFLPLTRTEHGAALIACAMAAVAAGSAADLFVRHQVIRPWLLPLGMVVGGLASVITSLVISEPAIPPAALIGVCAAAVSHTFRRLLSPQAGSYAGPGQIATGLASVGLVGAMLWAINEFLVP